MKVKLIEHPSTEQIRWGSHHNTLGILEVGQTYEVATTEVHSFYTSYRLKGFEKYKFNSVTFEVIND